MKEQTKPHLRKHGWGWACSGKGWTLDGCTPGDAYKKWKLADCMKEYQTRPRNQQDLSTKQAFAVPRGTPTYDYMSAANER